MSKTKPTVKLHTVDDAEKLQRNFQFFLKVAFFHETEFVFSEDQFSVEISAGPLIEVTYTGYPEMMKVIHDAGCVLSRVTSAYDNTFLEGWYVTQVFVIQKGACNPYPAEMVTPLHSIVLRFKRD